MPPDDDNRRAVLHPGWLFATIIGILVSHLVFLYILLSLCTWGVRLNFLAILERDGVVTSKAFESGPARDQLALCTDLDDDFRNARNKAIEIVLALLVPTSSVAGYYANRKKKDDTDPTSKG